MTPIYEDNHIIIVSKQSGEIVQGDKTGDTPLSETVKDYIKVKYQKPGNVFLGVVHRLDRPVSGLVMFARTSKALARLNEMFRVGDVHKTYWAIVQRPSKSPCIGGLLPVTSVCSVAPVVKLTSVRSQISVVYFRTRITLIKQIFIR